MRQSEHILYITLIDFLLQLLFLGLVLSVIYSALQPDQEETKANQSFVKNIKQLTGISDLTKLTDELTRLGPLQKVYSDVKYGQEAKTLFQKVGGKENASKLLTDEAKKAGQGRPSCMPNSERIATFDAYSDRIELRQPITPEMTKILNFLNISKDKAANIPLSEFRSLFAAMELRNDREKCVYNVFLYEHTFDTRPRDKFRNIFLPSTRPAAGLTP
jgi:hypothetical protein